MAMNQMYGHEGVHDYNNHGGHDYNNDSSYGQSDHYSQPYPQPHHPTHDTWVDERQYNGPNYGR